MLQPRCACRPGHKPRQVLYNVDPSASEAKSPEVGEVGVVSIAARVEKSTVTIIIADQGKGLRATTNARKFEPFFTTRPNGMGLGLSISKEHHRERRRLTRSHEQKTVRRWGLMPDRPPLGSPVCAETAGRNTRKRRPPGGSTSSTVKSPTRRQHSGDLAIS